jgi:hypothetical protein
MRASSAAFGRSFGSRRPGRDASRCPNPSQRRGVSDAWNGQTLDLTGPESIDYATVAAEIGKQLGREVIYVPVSPRAAGEAVLKATGDVWHARTVEEFAIASSAGFGDFTTDNVAKLTGHAPRSIRDFVRDELTRAVTPPEPASLAPD